MGGLNIKNAAAAGVVGIIVSLISGGIAGVGMGVLILRALVGGLGFFVLGIAVQLVVRQFLPELASSESGVTGGLSDLIPSDVSGDEQVSGSRVDIVSEDEASPQSYSEQQDMSDGIQESESANPEAASALHSVDNRRFASSGSGGASSDTSILGDAVSGLPDLDSFSGTFQSGSDDEEDEDNAGDGGDSQAFSSYSPTSRVDGNQIVRENDPADIAKAIRTVLNRDNG